MNAVTPERVTLYYREGTSDKVYQAAIEPAARSSSSTSPTGGAAPR